MSDNPNKLDIKEQVSVEVIRASSKKGDKKDDEVSGKSDREIIQNSCTEQNNK